MAHPELTDCPSATATLLHCCEDRNPGFADVSMPIHPPVQTHPLYVWKPVPVPDVDWPSSRTARVGELLSMMDQPDIGGLRSDRLGVAMASSRKFEARTGSSTLRAASACHYTADRAVRAQGIKVIWWHCIYFQCVGRPL